MRSKYSEKVTPLYTALGPTRNKLKKYSQQEIPIPSLTRTSFPFKGFESFHFLYYSKLKSGTQYDW